MPDLVSTLIQIDRNKPQSLVDQLIAALRQLISDGRLGEGFQLPSSRALSAQLGVSRNTVMFAVEQLTAEGYLAVSHGRRPRVLLQSSIIGPSTTPSITRKLHAGPKLQEFGLNNGASIWPPDSPEPMLPLRQGRADHREFPHDVWARSLRRAARKGMDIKDVAVNRRSLQKALSMHLAQHRGVTTEPDQIVVVPTAQAGLKLIMDLVLNPGDTAWTESPGYPGARAAIEASIGRVVGIELDDWGMAFDAYAASPPKLLFTTPTHQFPTGRLMSVVRRQDLLTLAKTRNAWIVEDDYDGELHYDERPVPALQGLDSDGRVFYVGTFSKTTFSDIRIGYIVVPPQLLRTFQRAQLSMGLLASVQVQEALADFISNGHYGAHIRRLRRLYRDRRDHLANGIRSSLGDVLDVEVPPGGMQLVAWCRKRTADDREIVNKLANAGVVARPASEMYLGSPARNGLLLGFAAWQLTEIDMAISAMRKVFQAHEGNHKH